MKRIIYTIIASAILLGTSIAHAQTVNYKVLRDDPSDIANLQVRVHPFYAEGFRLNQASLGTALELRYTLANKMMFQVNRWGSFSTIADGKFKLTELNTEYILSDKSKKEDIDIVLKSTTTQDAKYTYTTSKYITVPGTTRSLFTARGGVTHYTSPFKPYSLKKIELSQVKDTAGTTISGLDVSGTTMSATMITVGVAFHKITNIRVLVNNDLKRGNERWLSLYADLMYAPVVKLENFTGKNADWADSYFIIENGDNGILRKRLGWRYGLVADFHSKQLFTFSGRVELGSRPGIKSNGFYLRCGLGLTVNLL